MQQEHITQFIVDCSIFGILIQGIIFIWKTHYGNNNIECPKLDLLCREIPLEGQNYKCALTYSICKANIDLDSYYLIIIKFNNEQIKLTPTLFMDMG